MKYVIYFFVGILLVFTVLPAKEDSNSKLKSNETSSIATSEVKAGEVKEPVKVEESKAPEVSTPPPTVDVVKENPKNCDTSKEWILPDGTCKAKANESIASSTVASETATTGNCDLVRNYTNWNVNVAYAVCMAESGGNSNAANYNDNHGTCRGSFGLMQLACFWIPNPTDPVANIAKANEIYSRSGWKPWGAYTSGAYTKYLR